MLQEIISTRDFDFTNYRELYRYAKELRSEDYSEIFNILNNDFDSSLYIEQTKTLKLIGLLPKVYKKTSGASKYIHGIYHVEKVFLYCYIMVKKYNEEHEEHIPDDLVKALYYAALYHDVGRVDNSESRDHGLNSARIFYEVFKDKEEFKNNKEKLYFIESLMAIHSEKYEIEENDDTNIDTIIQAVLYEHIRDWNDTSKVKAYAGKYFKILCDILKDADALDRKRFGEWQRASLNEDYLRTSYSKELVHFADEINKLYYSVMQSNFDEPDFRYKPVSDCFHSIGFDFFKIKSILNFGILSQEELKRRNIMVPRNFPGGNFDRWISVVDPSFYPRFIEEEYCCVQFNSKPEKPDYHVDNFIYNEKFLESNCEGINNFFGYSLEGNYDFSKKDIYDDDCDPCKVKLKYAAKIFTQQGVTFYCNNVSLFTPEEDRDKALEHGLPWNKSDYVDEKYVYQKIVPSNILGLFIPFECINYDVKDLWYIYESTNMEIVRSRIEYYKRYTEVLKSDKRIEILNSLLDEYEMLTVNELSKPTGEGNSYEYFKESNRIMTYVNKIIGEFVYEYYCKKLNTKVFGIKDIVEYEVSCVKNIDYEITNLNEINCNELLFLINVKDEKVKKF